MEGRGSGGAWQWRSVAMEERGSGGPWLSAHHLECSESALWVFIPSKVTDSWCDLKQSFCYSVSPRKIVLT